MKIKLFVLTIVSTALLISNCGPNFNLNDCVNGKGQQLQFVVSTDAFQKIDVQIDAEVHVKKGTKTEVVIFAQQNIYDEIKTYVSSDILKFAYNHCVNNQQPVIINIETPTLDGLKISGSGNITVDSTLTTNRLDLKVLGSGSIWVNNLKTGYINTHISGSGNINVASTDTITTHEILLDGSGNLNALNLPTQNLTIDILGSGSCNVNAITKLDVYIAGSGGVYYKGNPQIISNLQGTGKVVKVNSK